MGKSCGIVTLNLKKTFDMCTAELPMQHYISQVRIVSGKYEKPNGFCILKEFVRYLIYKWKGQKFMGP